jgi:hypothetical protein
MCISKILSYFAGETKKENVNLVIDIGKSCLRIKKPENIPFELIGELVKKITVQDWIATYEAAFKK